MLKRIALATVFVVSAAFVGVSVAKAQSGAKKVGSIQLPAPQGLCPPGIKC
jgi:hypothetical protein